MAEVESRIDCCQEEAEGHFDYRRCEDDSRGGVMMTVDFGLDCGGRSIPVVVVLLDRMPTIASAAVVVAVLDNSPRPKMAASGEVVSAQIRVAVDLPDTVRMHTDLVALVVCRMDLEMARYCHTADSTIHCERPDSERILRLQLPQRRLPMDFAVIDCPPRTEPKALSMVVVLRRNEYCRLEIGCEFVHLFERLWFVHHQIPPMLPTWKIGMEVYCWVTSCCWAY